MERPSRRARAVDSSRLLFELMAIGRHVASPLRQLAQLLPSIQAGVIVIQEEFKKSSSSSEVDALVCQYGLKAPESARSSPMVLDEWTGAIKGNAIYMKHPLLSRTTVPPQWCIR